MDYLSQLNKYHFLTDFDEEIELRDELKFQLITLKKFINNLASHGINNTKTFIIKYGEMHAELLQYYNKINILEE